MSDVPPQKPETRAETSYQFACLMFDANDNVGMADMIDAPRKAVAMQRAMSLIRIFPDFVGFQLWSHGTKIAEYFPRRHEAAGKLVTGPIAPPGRNVR